MISEEKEYAVKKDRGELDIRRKENTDVIRGTRWCIAEHAG